MSHENRLILFTEIFFSLTRQVSFSTNNIPTIFCVFYLSYFTNCALKFALFQTLSTKYFLGKEYKRSCTTNAENESTYYPVSTKMKIDTKTLVKSLDFSISSVPINGPLSLFTVNDRYITHSTNSLHSHFIIKLIYKNETRIPLTFSTRFSLPFLKPVSESKWTINEGRSEYILLLPFGSKSFPLKQCPKVY